MLDWEPVLQKQERVWFQRDNHRSWRVLEDALRPFIPYQNWVLAWILFDKFSSPTKSHFHQPWSRTISVYPWCQIVCLVLCPVWFLDNCWRDDEAKAILVACCYHVPLICNGFKICNKLTKSFKCVQVSVKYQYSFVCHYHDIPVLNPVGSSE